jgi:hypothetical protein
MEINMTCNTKLDPIPQGNTRDIVVVITDINGLVVDITNDKFNLIVKLIKTSPDSAAVINITNGIGEDVDHSGPLNGQTTFILTSTHTNVALANYYYEITRVEDGGEITTLVLGRVSITDTLKDTV